MELCDGRYLLDDVLGSGGAATVYRARDTSLGVTRAIKVLHGGNRAHEPMRRRMIAEAKAMARLDHPNILTVYDIGRDGDTDFVVMELAERGSLSDMLFNEGTLSPVRGLQYTIQILAALAAAHNAGIVHRDVKPQNVLIDRAGTALLADFGIALVADDAFRGTRTGVAMGSLAFMPPEQRLDARSVGNTADIYAAGATLYALLTARNPVDLFTASTDSKRWDGLSPDLVALIGRATAQNPDDRYADAGQMAADVLACLDAAGERPIRPPSPSDEGYFPMPSERLSGVSSAGLLPDTVDYPDPTQGFEEAAGYLTGLGVTKAGSLPSNTLAPMTDAGETEGMVLAPPPGLPGPPVPKVASTVPAKKRTAANLPVFEPRASRRRFFIPVLLGAVVVCVCLGWALLSPVAEPGSAPTVEGSLTVEPADPPGESDGVLVAQPKTKPPEPVQVVTKAPATTPKPPEVEPGLEPPLGRWSGSINGKVASLVLGGSRDAPKGVFEVRFGGNTVASGVSGTWDPAARTLRLEDVGDQPDAAVYEATLNEDLTRMEGRLSYKNQARMVPFAMRRP